MTPSTRFNNSTSKIFTKGLDKKSFKGMKLETLCLCSFNVLNFQALWMKKNTTDVQVKRADLFSPDIAYGRP